MMTVLRFLAAGAVAVLTALSFSSCGCCTGEASPPPLKPLPPFKEIPVIHSGK